MKEHEQRIINKSYEEDSFIGNAFSLIQKENEEFKKSLDDRFMELRCAYEFISVPKKIVLDAGDIGILNVLLDHQKCTKFDVDTLTKYFDEEGRLSREYDKKYNELRNFYFRAKSFRPDLCEAIEMKQ